MKEAKFWKLYKEDKPSCAIVIRSAAGLVHLLAQLLEPFMPSFSREVGLKTHRFCLDLGRKNAKA